MQTSPTVPPGPPESSTFPPSRARIVQSPAAPTRGLMHVLAHIVVVVTPAVVVVVVDADVVVVGAPVVAVVDVLAGLVVVDVLVVLRVVDELAVVEDVVVGGVGLVVLVELVAGAVLDVVLVVVVVIETGVTTVLPSATLMATMLLLSTGSPVGSGAEALQNAGDGS